MRRVTVRTGTLKSGVYAGVAQLVARLLAMQKVCGFESRHLLTVEIIRSSVSMPMLVICSYGASTLDSGKSHGTPIGGSYRSSREVTASAIFGVCPIRHLGSRGVPGVSTQNDTHLGE